MNTQSLRVMVVDDDHPYSVVLKKTLTGHGHDVLVCSSAEEAFHHLQKEQFDIMLLDYKMEGTNGINVLQWMYGMKMDIPVIIITGYGSEEIALEAWKWGAKDYFVKGKSDMSQLPALVLKVYKQAVSERQHRVH